MKRIITLALVAGLVAGCVSVGRKIDQSAVDKIKKGETTKEQVLKLLGSPDQMTTMGNGDVTFMYMHARVSTKPESFIPVVGLFAGGANVRNQIFMVTFGSDGVVKDLMSSRGATDSAENLGAGSKPDVKDVEQNKRPR